jgi:hypothetical protein
MRIADHIILGPNKERDPQETIHIFNNTDHDLIVSVAGEEYLVYPLVIVYIPRPTEGQTVNLSINGKSASLSREQFHRKMNVVDVGVQPDLSMCILTYKLWHAKILSMSDRITIQDKVIIYYKAPDDVGTDTFFKFTVALFVYEIFLIILVLVCFAIIKCLFSTTYGMI